MCDSEAPKAFKRIQRKANKSHTCCECGSEIKKGEKYHYVSGIWDEPQSFKTCLSCIDVLAEYELRHSFSPPITELKEYVIEQCYHGFGLQELISESPETAEQLKKLLRKELAAQE